MEQAGLYKLTLYENKGLNVVYNDNKEPSEILNSGDIYTFSNEFNEIRFQYNIDPAFNNNLLYEYKVNIIINSIEKESIEIAEKLSNSIYGFIPVLELMKNEKYIILSPFFATFNTTNLNISNTLNVELSTRNNITSEIQKIGIIQPVTTLNFISNTNGTSVNFSATVNNNVDLEVNWGDGVIENYNITIFKNFSHVYSSTGIFEIILNFSNNDYIDRLIVSNAEVIKIPDNINLIKNVTWFSVFKNDIIELPETLFELQYLERLDLTDNKLTNLPEAITQLTFLQVLILDNNNITTIENVPNSVKLFNLSIVNNFLNQENVDKIYIELLNFYINNTTESNLTVSTSGTNSNPSLTGISAINQLQTIFNNAGYTFTAFT